MTKTFSHLAAAVAALLLTVVTIGQTVTVPAPTGFVETVQIA